MARGFFQIGIVQGKTEENLGTLWRSAYQLGATGIFTIGRRYKKQCSDTYKTYRHIPLINYPDFETFLLARPENCSLVGIEMGGVSLSSFNHPSSAIYLLGSEDGGLPDYAIAKCQSIISIEVKRVESFNVAVAGSLVMYSRLLQKSLVHC